MTRTDDRRTARGASEAASAALDVMLTDAALEGARASSARPGRRGRRGPRAPARPHGAPRRRSSGAELARVAAGRSDAAPRASATAASPIPRGRRAGCSGGCCRPTSRSRRHGRRPDRRRRARLARRAPGALRRRQPARRARAEQLPVVEPGRDQGRPSTEGGLNLVRGARSFAGDFPHLPSTVDTSQVRGRREPRADARARSCCAPRSSSSSSTRRRPPRSARSRCCSCRRRSTSTTCSTSRRAAAWSSSSCARASRCSSSPGATRTPSRATSTSTPTPPRCSRRATRSPRITGSRRSTSTAPARAASSAPALVGHLAAEGRLGEIASLTLMVCALDNERAGTASAFTDREVAAAAVAESARRGYLDRQALGRRVHLAAPERPRVELRRQQLPAGQAAAGVRRPLLEPGHRAPRRRPAPRLHPLALDNSLARPGRARGARHAASTSATSTSTATSSPASPTTSSRGRTRTAATRAARRRARASCSPPAATSRRSSTRPAADSRSSYRVADEPTSPGGVGRAAPRCPAAGGPTTTSGWPRAPGDARPAPQAPRRRRPRRAKAPGTYVHAPERRP